MTGELARDRPTARSLDTGDARWIRLLAMSWAACLLLLAFPALAAALSHKVQRIAIYFLVAQDLPVLAIATLGVALLAAPWTRLPAGASARAAEFARRRGARLCAGLCLGVAAVSFVGWLTVYRQYPLSMDEFWATFDASIIRRGGLLAKVPLEWRSYAPALQPMFSVAIAGHTHWGSFYLPIHPALMALASYAGSPALAEPIGAAFAVAATYGLARRYWPHRPDAAVVAAVLLATSAQLVVTAMTPYAMTAQLALNLGWLWLFQRKDAPSQIGAVGAAFLATGAHQVVFHPLFAAPFVLQLWLGRRWRLAALQTLAYAAICLFWAGYFGLMLPAQGAIAATSGGEGIGNFARRSLALVAQFQLADPALMAVNLVRFIAWQNPLGVALGAAGVGFAVRERHQAMWPLAAGLALTTVAMLVIMPFQGHGWGYRYLHGLLGSLCLLAAFAWVRLVDPSNATARRAWAGLGLATAFSVMVALPIRAWQAAKFVGPYATAHRTIEHASADVVIVDPSGLWYGVDLVRNDPFLAAGPKVMDIEALSADQVQALCATHRIAVFDKGSTGAAGITRVDDGAHPQAVAMRALMQSIRCGTAMN